MNQIKLDQALSAFVDSPECQKINEALLETVCAAYEAGWNAATEYRQIDGGQTAPGVVS